MGRKKGSTDMKHSLTRPDPDGIEMKQRIYKVDGAPVREVARTREGALGEALSAEPLGVERETFTGCGTHSARRDHSRLPRDVPHTPPSVKMCSMREWRRNTAATPR